MQRPTLGQIDFLFSKLSEGFAYCKIVTDKQGKPIDWVYLDVNDAYERINGVPKESVIGKKATEVLQNIKSDPADWLNLYGHVALTGEPVVVERYAEVRQKWYHISAYSPEKGFFVSIFEDISERKKTEQALTQSEAKYRSLFINMMDGFAHCQMIFDKDGKPIDFIYLDVNDAFERLTGLRADAVLGKKVSEAIPGTLEANPELIEIYGRVAITCTSERFEIYFKPLSKWFFVSVYCERKGYFMATFQNITERKEAEAALRESEQRWVTTLSSIGDAVIATDTSGKVTFMNPVAEQLTGWSAIEAHGEPINSVFKIINELTGGNVENPVAKVLKLGIVVGLANHTLLIRKDGTKYPIDDSGAPIVGENGTIQGVVLVFRDITENKKAEDDLQRQASLINLSPDGIIIKNLDDIITFWNEGAEKLYGWTAKEAVGQKSRELFKTRFLEPFENILNRLKLEGLWTGEKVHTRKDGQQITVSSRWLTRKNSEGQIIEILETNEDITVRKKAEQEISRLASFPTLNPNPVVEVDENDRVTYTNPVTKTLFPNLESEGISNVFFDNWESVKQEFRERNTNTFAREIKIDDHWYHQQLYMVPYTQQIRVYATDIDELKQTEEARARAQTKLEENATMLEEYANQMEELATQRAQQLQNAERLAAIGATAGMVGHDIRNPLQAITGDMYLIAQEVEEMPEVESKQSIVESLDSVNRNLVYINKIVSDLQDYTRPLKPNLQNASLAELVESTLVTIIIPKGIEVTTNIAEDAKPIRTDVAYMRRLLQNLITNAVQAMQEEGKITIEAVKRNDKVVLSVEDTGTGIPEEVKTKMFTPLFTTKSKGQGLGLAVVRRLVDAFNGTISFESTAGKGTKFMVELPQNA